MSYTLHLGDCVDVLPTLPDASVDCVVSDPPYPEISRPYGRMTESAWMDMMQTVVRQTRRILKPTGSAVFILQPNSRKVGSMRLWLWEFMVWAGKEWNIVQDFYWWNHNSPPTVHTHCQHGLSRPSTKMIVWLGKSDCYRNQSAVLWQIADATTAINLEDRLLKQNPSGYTYRRSRAAITAINRGGSTPYNLLPMGNSNEQHNGHGAGTPLKLADWWVRYICPPGGVVADWFSGTGTMGLAALNNGCSYIGIEKMPEYHAIAQKRLAEASAQPSLLAVEGQAQ